jgi:hypothetical protein
VIAPHFLQTVPPLAIGAALAVTNPSEPFFQRDARGRLETRSQMLLLFAVALALGFLYTERHAYLGHVRAGEMSTDRAAAHIAEIIREQTDEGEPIYVWGTRPQIYILADRPAAHRIFYNRPLNIEEQVNDFFGPDVFEDIYETLVATSPRFFVTTEQYVEDEEHIARLGPMAPWFFYVRARYQLWGDPIQAEPYWFTIFARDDATDASTRSAPAPTPPSQ